MILSWCKKHFSNTIRRRALAEETDPNRLYDLQSQLDGFELYEEDDN